jgi:hypothetical protein
MEKSSKRGKIPQTDWPLIMARYEAGETLSSIARTYDCSPPAISYVVSRSRARQPAGETPRPAPAGEPQLIKAAGGNCADHTGNRDAAAVPPAQAAPPSHAPVAAHAPEAPPAYTSPTASHPPSGDRRFEIRSGNGDGYGRPLTGEREAHASNLFASSAPSSSRSAEPSAPQGSMPQGAAPQAPANADPRGRLHLPLGNGSQANGGSLPGEPSVAERPQPPLHSPQSDNGGRPAWAVPAAQRYPEHQAASPTGAPLHGNGGHPGAHGRGDARSEQRKEGGGAFIDSELRARVDADIAVFLSAFDAALAEDTPESRTALREATDRLLRAGARTRIELERLEARMPLPPRDTGRQEPAWRHR